MRFIVMGTLRLPFAFFWGMHFTLVKSEITDILCKGKYFCTGDLIYDRFGFNQTSNSVLFQCKQSNWFQISQTVDQLCIDTSQSTLQSSISSLIVGRSMGLMPLVSLLCDLIWLYIFLLWQGTPIESYYSVVIAIQHRPQKWPMINTSFR